MRLSELAAKDAELAEYHNSDFVLEMESNKHLRRELEQERAKVAENMCDACAGTGTPNSGLPCMCGGTGKMSDAARYLREQLVSKEAELSQERAKVTKLRAKLYLLKEEIRRLWLDK